MNARGRLSKATIEEERRHFLQVLLSTSAVKSNIHSPAAVREHLFGGFLNDLTWLQTTPARHQSLQMLRMWFDGGKDDGALAAATEALLLAQLSLTLQDGQYLAAAKRRYGLAISRCARKLATKPHGITHWIEVLATIQALGTCEMYEELAHGGTVWHQHNDGMTAIVRQLSVSAEDLTNDFTRMTVYNAIDTSLKTAVVASRPSVFVEGHWAEIISLSCEGRGWCLQHVVCHLPTLLYQMDNLPCDSTATEKIANLLEGLLKIERDLHRWLRTWYETSQNLLIHIKNISNFPNFVQQHRDVAMTFPNVFDFPSPAAAHGHLIYYDWLSTVRQAICILHLRTESSLIVSDDDRAYALRNATECADAACMLVPYSSRMEKTEPSKSLLQVLGSAARWYGKTEQIEKLRYAQHITEHQGRQYEYQYLLRWQDVNGFLVRRVLLEQCIGPARCILRDDG